jgi:hypothetical protein
MFTDRIMIQASTGQGAQVQCPDESIIDNVPRHDISNLGVAQPTSR